MLFVLLSLTAASATLGNARISTLNPLASQLPPIGRVGSPFEWTISSKTFSGTGAIINYSAPTVPDWLSFDPFTRTFYGVPATSDVGVFEVAITASDSSDSKTSKTEVIVSGSAPPVLVEPISSQFLKSNPSLSSVFLLRNGSALATPNPTLRIPPEWSFSIGFEGGTFKAANNLFYDGRQADGSSLPTWIKFSPDDITFHGYTPKLRKGDAPVVLSLALHVSDFVGYTASALPFDIVIASHELSVSTSSLPTINVTAATPFNVSLSSPADFQGVLQDDSPLQPRDLLALELDVAAYRSWLSYDKYTRTLSGTPPPELPTIYSDIVIPVTLIGQDHQQAKTNMSVAIVPSYFTTNDLDHISTPLGQVIDFNLSPYVNHQSGQDVKLTAEYVPASASQFLNFNATIANLTGTIPKDFESSSVVVTFTAYSNITHSTSHCALHITIQPDGTNSGLSPKPFHSHKGKIVLALQVACGVTGGLLLLGIILAVFRRYARVGDTALEGEEGRRAWSDDEKKYYGFGIPNIDDTSSSVPPAYVDRPKKNYGAVSHGPRNVSKAEFFSRLRSTVRTVSGKYRSRQVPARPVISRPMPLNVDDAKSHSTTNVNTLDCPDPTSYSSSDAESSRRSFPEVAAQRRADFAPPQLPPRAVSDWRDHRTASLASTNSTQSSSETVESARIHESEAIVQTASRARSIRSERSTSGLSYVSLSEPSPAGRPRLVPFTSSARVPQVNQAPPVPPVNTSGNATWTVRRVPSQRATVITTDRARSDDWSLGVHYVRALGGDETSGDESSILSAPTERLSVLDTRTSRYSSGSFSLASSKHTATHHASGFIPRIVVRTGERFKFRIPLRPSDSTVWTVRLVSGNPLPQFATVEVMGGAVAEVQGVPRREDEGEVRLGVYDATTGICLGKAVLEVVSRV